MVQIINVLSLCVASLTMSASVQASCSNTRGDSPPFGELVMPALENTVITDDLLDLYLSGIDALIPGLKQCAFSFTKEDVTELMADDCENLTKDINFIATNPFTPAKKADLCGHGETASACLAKDNGFVDKLAGIAKKNPCCESVMSVIGDKEIEWAKQTIRKSYSDICARRMLRNE